MATTKNNILKILEDNKGNFVSGQTVANKLKISRTAIWKAVKTLKSEGYEIESVQNNGYKLSENNDILSQKEIRENLLPEYKNFDIKIFKKIDSTNDFAKKLVAKNNFENGTTIIADEQTAGRGRFGRTFFSPANTGIYLSTIIKIPLKLSDISLTTVISALSVCKTIEKLTNLKPQIKWINDIFIDGKKVCGILTEAVTDFETQTSQAVIVGIGINIKTSKKDFPEELQNKAVSLTNAEDGNFLSRNIFTAELLNNLYSSVKNIHDKNIIKEYKKLSLILNKEIKYIDNDTVITATAVDINDKGNLIVRHQNSKQAVLESAEISIKF